VTKKEANQRKKLDKAEVFQAKIEALRCVKKEKEREVSVQICLIPLKL
jgi:hypothetical protein